MKKNTITKLLLILVMALLVFSLFACGNKEDKKPAGKKTLSTPVVTVDDTTGSAHWESVPFAGSYRVIVTQSDGTEKTEEITGLVYQLQEGEDIIVIALPKKDKADIYNASNPSDKQTYAASGATQIINLLNSVKGAINKWNNVDTDFVADVAIGGFFESGRADGDKKRNGFSLRAQTNINETSPEFMIGFQLNEKDYVSLGFKDGKVYVREPLNLVNTDDTDANAFVIDLTALKPCLPKIMKPVMTLIKSDYSDIPFETLLESVAGFLTNMGDAATILNFADNGDEKVISATVGTLNTALLFVGRMPGIEEYIPKAETDRTKIDEYIGYFYKVTDALKMDRIQINGEDITTWGILNKLKDTNIKDNCLFNITLKNEGADVKKISVDIDLGALAFEGIQYKFGLTIDLNKISNQSADRVTIDTTGFTPQDLEIDLGGILGKKNLSADVKAVLRLSDALAAAGNKWATLSVNNKLAGYIDGTGAYADFAPAFEILGVDSYTANPTAFKANYLTDGANVISKFVTDFTKDGYKNPIEKAVEDFIAKKAAEAAAKNAAMDEIDSFMSNPIGYITALANEFGAAENKIDFVCAKLYPFLEEIDSAATAFKPAQGPVTQATVIDYIFHRELGDSGSYIAQYALFYEDATTFEQLGNNIKAKHEAGKAALTAATYTDDTKAGVQLYKDGENNDLLDYIANFVVIPSIKNDAPSFEEEDLKAPNDKAALKGWLNWIFPVDNEYRDMVEDILGIGLEAIIDEGVYCEAINLGGFNGAIRVAADKETANGDSYAYLSAGFGMKASAAAPAGTIEAQASSNDKDGEGDYVIASTAQDLLDALCDYGRD